MEIERVTGADLLALTVLKEFGEEYRAYQRQVPMFIPRWGRWRQLAAASRNSSENDTV